MGNTYLPQAGAADTKNSRDTLSGDEQLSDAERRKRDAADRDSADKSRDVGPAPSRPKDAPPRIPGQPVAGDGADDPGVPGHVGTGHSPPDAT